MKKDVCLLIIAMSLINAQIYNTFNYGGENRGYYLYLPDSLGNDAPLIMGFHGYSGSAESFINYTEIMDVADQFGFAVCSPQGTLDDWNNSFWNVGYSFHANETVDDVGFVSALAEYLQNEYSLSEEKTFCTGMSNGGDLSFLLACEASEIFAAVAPVAGTMMLDFYNECNPEYPIPIFEIHGTNDDITYWDGDINDEDGWGPYLDIPTIIEFWIQENNCTEYSMDTLPDIYPNDGSYVISHQYSGGINDNQVWFYEVVNGGHDWPGIWGNMDIHSTEEIWNFFELTFLNTSVTSVKNYDDKFTSFSLEQNYPNPFNPTTTIEFSIKNSSNVLFEIFDLNGRLVITLLNKKLYAGKHQIVWAGNDELGEIISSGIYFYKISINKEQKIKSMVYIK